MATWDEAFLIFKKWRDESSLVVLMTVTEFGKGEAGDPVYFAGGPTVRIKEVLRPERTLLISEEGETGSTPIDLNGGEFEYRDTRQSPFPGISVEGWICFVEVTFGDRPPLVFGELRDLTEAS
jgi:hypothetical protein